MQCCALPFALEVQLAAPELKPFSLVAVEDELRLSLAARRGADTGRTMAALNWGRKCGPN